MSEQTTSPFFVNSNGEQMKSVYHGNLTKQRDLVLKFKQQPFDSKYKTEGTSGKIVYFELADDGQDYALQIENDAVVDAIRGCEIDVWVKVSASGSGPTATLEVYPVAPFELEDVAPQVTEPPQETPPSSQDGNTPPPVTPDPVVIHDRPASTHIDCVAMTIETFEAFNRAGIGLDAMAVSRIYNTHFIALSRRGLVR
jgi:hypothetical protein